MRPDKQVINVGRALVLGAAAVALSLVVAVEATAQKAMVAPSLNMSAPRMTAPPPTIRPTPPSVRPPSIGPIGPSGPTGPRPDRPRGPNWGGIGTGVAIGTGIVINNATANPGPRSAQKVQKAQKSKEAANTPRGPRVLVNIPPANERRFVPNEVILEIAGAFTPQVMNQLAARHRLTLLESQAFTLTNSTFFRLRINDGRSVRSVLTALGREGALRSAQPNYLYRFAQAEDGASFTPPAPETPPATPAMGTLGARPSAGDPAQYTLAKLRLGEAHGLARGSNVLVAVIDSGVDVGHPELNGVIAGSFDALSADEKPHSHGTAIAGAIAAQSRLMGVAPAARILAIRAFGASGNTAEATTFAILRSVDHAAGQGARIINMSFAGPSDPGLSRQLAAARTRGIVLIAAAGNAGPKSPPLYPAADPNVIAVSATDPDDRLFDASNRGKHIAIAAPGVDILLPAPEANYQVTSGTSFAAAHVSGIAALMLEKQPSLTHDGVRRILQSSAKDLGPRGKDDQFGAGLADAYQAILAVEPAAAAPVAAGAPAARPVSTR